MTEAEWNSCTEPKSMLRFLRDRGKLSERKARLFAVACCRRVSGWLTDERWQRAVELAELAADEPASREEAAAAIADLHYSYLAAPDIDGCSATADVASFCYAVAKVGTIPVLSDAALFTLGPAWGASRKAERAVQADLLRELFGLLPRRAGIDPAWLAWNDGIIPKLATSIYENRQLPSGLLDTVRLAILADALEEAGCADAEVLGHLRSAGPHVRGCFPVDLLLEKS